MTRQLTSKSSKRSSRLQDTPPKRGLKLTTNRNAPNDCGDFAPSQPTGKDTSGELCIQELDLAVGDQFTIGGCLVRVVASVEGEATLELVSVTGGTLDERVELGEDVRPRQPR